MEQEQRLRWLGWIYAGTILLSAFLLFQVQPLISKFILPWFGGSPTVWTTCMLFFQTLLFGGYAYAHLNEHFFRPGVKATLHVVLIASALLMIPTIPAENWKPVGNENPTWRILALLLVTVGLPYFVLSSTGPLVQAWFSRTFPNRSPYRLYALSNIGSLAALLTYPVLVEPMWDVKTQARLWAAGFAAFAVLCGYAAMRVWSLGGEPANPQAADLATLAEEPPGVWRRLLWLVLPGFASLMLLATTNHVCQDVAVIPFLWVVPLALYLVSFIISFDHERWYVRPFFAAVTAILILTIAGGYEWLQVKSLEPVAVTAEQLNAEPWWKLPELTFLNEAVLDFAALFGLCMICHGELVRLRPQPKYLTSFYMMISAGGALGGIFVSLVAPHVFISFAEWTIGMVGGFMLATLLLAISVLRAQRFFRPDSVLEGTTIRYRANAAVGFAALLVLAGGVAGAMTIVHFQRGDEETVIDVARNFYGVVRVVERKNPVDPSLDNRLLYNGRIIHGVQFTSAARRRDATTYYNPESGVGRAVGYFRNRDEVRVGTIGLGVGTIAAYGLPGHQFKFYEINPEVERLAKDVFTYLNDSEAETEVVLGDARLSLEREADQRFDVLALDAFSGDAIPTHLLTSECFEIYMRHLASHGVLAVHVTNRYLDLDPVVSKLATKFNLLVSRISTTGNEGAEVYQSDWMLLTKDANLHEVFESAENSKPPPKKPRDIPLWTDGHTNLFQILMEKNEED